MRAALLLILVGCGAHEAPSAPRPAACPATFAAAKQARPSCEGSPSCSYPEGVCGCVSPCRGLRHDEPLAPIWECKVLPAACPASPTDGAPCPQLGMTCEYVNASSCGGTVARCETTGCALEVIPKAG